MAVKKRCIRCRQHVREDGTCQNQKCVLYVPEESNNEKSQQESPAVKK